MANVFNFFKFLEDKVGKRAPLKVKLLNDPRSIAEEDLYVAGNLDLEKTNIETLPDNLNIEGTLYLDHTPIKTLPKNLKVGGNLFLTDSSIEKLPKDLEVFGDLVIRHTPLANKYLDKFSVGQLLWPNKEAYAEDRVIKSIAYLGGSVYLHK